MNLVLETVCNVCIGCDVQIRQPSVKFTDVSEYVGSILSQVLDWFENVNDQIIDPLWKQYVPEKGECTVLQGELARASCDCKVSTCEMP